MFPGRVILGIGTGESLNEVPATGMQWPEPKERTRAAARGGRADPQLWSEERVSFEGEYYQTEKATIYDRPEQPVPIYIAAAGPVIAKYAGRAGRGLHLHQRQGAGAVQRDAAAERRRGLARRRAAHPTRSTA